MNTRKGRANFKKFQILLESGRRSTIVTGRLVEKLYNGNDAVMQWYTQASNISTNLKVKVNFTLPELSATNLVTWKYNVDDSAKGRYNMILGKYLLI